MKGKHHKTTDHKASIEPSRAVKLHRPNRKRVAALGQALALVALARKIGLRRGIRVATLAADAYLAHEAFKRRPRHQH